MSAWFPVAPCAPGLCVTDPIDRAAPLRRALRWASGLGALLAGVLLSPLAVACSRRTRARLVRIWCRSVARAFGVRVRLTGPGLTQPVPTALVVANHVSWLDIPLLAAVRPARMVAKSDIRSWPVLGWLVAAGSTIFIERNRLRTLPGTVSEMADALRHGSSVVVFPEAGTWCGRRRGRFRPAAFQAAMDARVPVQPVRIRYRLTDGRLTTVASFVGEDTLLASLRRVVAARGLVAELDVLTPIAAGTCPDRGSLARCAQAAVNLDMPTRHAPGQSVSGVGLPGPSDRVRGCSV